MYRPRQVFTAACLGMLVFGVASTTLGSIIPSIIPRFGVDKAQAGSLLSLLSMGILSGSLVFGPVVDRFGYKRLLAFCAVLVAAGLEGIAYAERFPMLQLSVYAVGLGGGVLNGGTNALVADISGARRGARLSLLGVFFGAGAFGVPFALSFLMDYFSYPALVGALGLLVGAPLIYVLIVPFPAPKQTRGFPIREGARLLRQPVLLLVGGLLFIQSGIEITVGGWTASYFDEVIGVGPDDAVFFLSVFWAGMVLARLALGALLVRRDPAAVLKGFLALAMLGAVMVVATDRLALAAPGLFLMGFGLAATFPILLAYVGDLYPALSGTAFSIVFGMALTGGSIFPYLAGLVGDAAGLRPSFLLIPLLLAVVYAGFVLVLRLRARAVPAEVLRAAPSSPHQ